MLSQAKRQQVANKIASVARSRYGKQRHRKVRPPLDQLVQSILWRQASVRRGTRALRELKRTFVDWNEVRISPVVEISRAMSTADWTTRAAERIKKVLWSLFEAQNVVSLDVLQELTAAQARAFLRSLQDVTRDLADEALLFSLDANLLPVSDATARMCWRLGLIRNDRATLQNQKALMGSWDPEFYCGVALFFADYASSVCQHSKPRHKDCPLRSLCLRVGL